MQVFGRPSGHGGCLTGSDPSEHVGLLPSSHVSGIMMLNLIYILHVTRSLLLFVLLPGALLGVLPSAHVLGRPSGHGGFLVGFDPSVQVGLLPSSHFPDIMMLKIILILTTPLRPKPFLGEAKTSRQLSKKREVHISTDSQELSLDISAELFKSESTSQAWYQIAF